MDMQTSPALRDYAAAMGERLLGEYSIDERYYTRENIKRGLRNIDGSGVFAGVSKIGSVQGYYMVDGDRVAQPGHLYYRGIDVEEIVRAHRADNTFGYEEVAYLLLCGELPNAEEMARFQDALSQAKALPTGFFENEIFRSPGQNIMNSLARGVLALYNYDPCPEDLSVENSFLQAINLIARIPTIVALSYAMKRHYYYNDSLYIHSPSEQLSAAENFLRLIRHDKSFTDDEAKLLDTLLMLHAEHSGGNNSAFTCRCVSSTGSDIYSAVSAAIGSLKGPLHGGANAAVMHMIRDIREHVSDVRDDEEVGAYLDKLLDGEAGDRSGKLYGLGHAIYTVSDPRCVLLKSYIKQMADRSGRAEEYEIAERVERLGIPRLMARKDMYMPISANVDLYSGLVYSLLGIPEDLYTPLFAAARISGWCAHRMEEILCSRRIMRPAYRSAAQKRPYIPMSDRG